MKTKKIILILPLLLTLFLSSCFNNLFIDGNGDVVEEERTVPDFTQVSSSGDFDIYFEYADEPEVTISAESNLMMYIESVVYDNELKIRTPFNVNLRNHKTIEVYIKGPYVDRIELSGSGLIYTDTIFSDKLHLSTSGSGKIETAFIGGEITTNLSGSGELNVYTESDYTEVNISGSGKIYLEGSSKEALFTISGSGKFYGYDYPVNDLYIRVSGSGDLYVNAIDYLEATISGSGNVFYHGNPQIKTSISGSGSVTSGD